MSKVGRRPSFKYDEWLDAVFKLNTMDDKLIANEMGVNRSTVYRHRNRPKFAEYVKKAEEYLESLSEATYTKKLDSWYVFKEIPIIKEWDKILKDRTPKRRSDSYIIGLKRSIWYVCKHLRVHPNRLDVHVVADLVKEMRGLYYQGKKQPRGLAYSTLRESVRSFFTLIKHVSGEYLTQLGVDKSELEGSGKYAKQRIPVEVRIRFEKELEKIVNSYMEYLELRALAKWMYYTGSRIVASLEFNFSERGYDLTKNEWSLTILDKGEGGGQEWEKILTDFALDEFKKYCSIRFNIPIDKLESELSRKIDYLFPSFIDEDRKAIDEKVRKYYRPALINAGLSYKDFPPCHIFRHTFAQDFLDATDGNYELCASTGGWKSTYRLKKHYGERTKKSRVRGLKKAMGIIVEEEYYELNWYGAQKREKPFRCPECGNQSIQLLGICNKCKYISDSIKDWVNPEYKLKGN